MKRVSHVAGVTFCNDKIDGGQDRQKLLEHLYQYGPQIVNLEHTIFHNEETGADEDAIKVRSTVNNTIIGWIPRTDIEKLWNTSQMLLSINFYKDVWCGTLAEMESPTPAQYRLVKTLVNKGLINKPAYEKTIYGYWIEQVNKQKSYVYA